MWEIWTWEMFTVHQLVSVYLKLSRDLLNSAQACLVFFSYNLPVICNCLLPNSNYYDQSDQA